LTEIDIMLVKLRLEQMRTYTLKSEVMGGDAGKTLRGISGIGTLTLIMGKRLSHGLLCAEEAATRERNDGNSKLNTILK
jgi:hypothetical protein